MDIGIADQASLYGAMNRRETFHHGHLRSAALEAAYALVSQVGHAALTLRQVAGAVGVAHRSLYNHFADREALLDAVAAEAFLRLAARLKQARDAAGFTRKYVRFALADPAIYALMASRPHGTMKYNPSLQAAAHAVITQAMRIFCTAGQSSLERRREVMRIHMIHHGGISLYVAGILDLPNEKALIVELTAMTSQGGAP
jgi:AcrR family transcriptional regulator